MEVVRDDSSLMYGLSESDLNDLCPEYVEARKKGDEEKVTELLYHLGMDTNLPVELEMCLHRNLRDKEVYGARWHGYERIDKEWAKSGYASMAAIIASSSDYEFRKELRGMSKR